MLTRPCTIRCYTHDRGGFANLRHENILLYWPHGFGDWVQFSLVLPYLDRSNRYWMTRFGDDTVSVLAHHPIAAPVYLGINSPHCDDGGQFGNKHFGMVYERIDGSPCEIRAPLSLHDVIVAEGIDCLLWTWYPETHGTSPPPYHTKARSMARHLTNSLPGAFERPLPSTLRLEIDSLLMAMVETRLRNACGFGERRLCLIGRGGYTSVGKNWGHLWREDLRDERRIEGRECRDFIELMLRKSSNWCFLLMEDRNFADSLKDPAIHTFAYSDLFGEPEHGFAPFGLVMKCLARLASLCVGVPAGPYHFAAQVPELPTVGIWIEHLPSWYDEPRDGLVHVIARGPAEQIGREDRPGSFLRHGPFDYESSLLDSRHVPGAAVMEAVESVLGSKSWKPQRHYCPAARLPQQYSRYHQMADEFLARVGEVPAHYCGRGVVICGGGFYWPSAWVALCRLRAVGCSLPIQLWYLGPGELGPIETGLAARLEVDCVDALRIRERVPARILNGFELKPYSIINSPFAEVLLLDADNVAVEDPSALFDSASYRARGALFWPDRGRLGPDREIWSVCRVEYRDEPEFDSGQMLIDKRRCWRPLQLAMHFNEYSDFYYQHMPGDKDTYHLAWRHLSCDYGMVPHPLRHIDDIFHHHDEHGRKIFQHGVKWTLTGPHRRPREYRHYDECVAHLKELASQMAAVK